MGLLPKPAESGKITDNLYTIRDGHVSVFVYQKGSDVISVDAGFPGPNIPLQFKRLGLDPVKVTHLFLTHSDRDHTGGLTHFPNAALFMSHDERQMVDGRTPRFVFVQNKLGTTKEINFLGDKQVVQAGSIRVEAILTPGHTPGSMSYLINGEVLCTGDTLILKDGVVAPTMWLMNKDGKALRESIRKLAKLAGVKVLCTAHSGYTLDFRKAMLPWVEQAP
jgi:hydroxyacylglutathione hydrolase